MNEELLKYVAHEKVQGKRGEWQDYDVVIHYASLWIPLAVDPFNPERGVWEWIDWRKVDLFVGNEGETTVVIRDVKKHPSKWKKFEEELGDNILTVLLKVFLYQQGVEV